MRIWRTSDLADIEPADIEPAKAGSVPVEVAQHD
jgi:hypothetical protein